MGRMIRQSGGLVKGRIKGGPGSDGREGQDQRVERRWEKDQLGEIGAGVRKDRWQDLSTEREGGLKEQREWVEERGQTRKKLRSWIPRNIHQNLQIEVHFR